MSSASYYNHPHASTRLGGASFNHAPSHSESQQHYDDLRVRAREAHSAGDHSSGAQLNKQASDYIFRENNAPSRVAADTIDLHGQFVNEAEDIVEERIREAKRRGDNHLHVIVGKGNHSRDHVQKIKPRVEQVCREEGLAYHTEANEGRLFVDLRGGGGGGMPPMHQVGAPGYGWGGGGGGDYPGQPQPHHQGHPQYGGGGGGYPGKSQHQMDDDERLRREEMNMIMKCVKSCCTVM